jgi:hypothetical protein
MRAALRRLWLLKSAGPGVTVVDVLGQVVEGDVTTTTLRVLRGPFPDEMDGPAWLLPIESPLGAAAGPASPELHKLIASDASEHTLSYETYGVPVPLPECPGGPYELRHWWLPGAVAAVTNTTLRWERRAYDVEDDDELCLFTWERIEPGDFAYESDAGWITEEAYGEFIARDRLRLRSGRN